MDIYNGHIKTGNIEFPSFHPSQWGFQMSTTNYVRAAQRTMVNGVELFRRRHYLTREALDAIDSQAERLNMSPSEYVNHLALTAAVELPTS